MDTHNFGPIVPGLFAAHEARFKEAAEEIERLRAELAEANDYINRLRGENEGLKDALVSIEEYWNRDQNEKAMADACWHAVETAAAALAAKE